MEDYKPNLLRLKFHIDKSQVPIHWSLFCRENCIDISYSSVHTINHRTIGCLNICSYYVLIQCKLKCNSVLFGCEQRYPIFIPCLQFNLTVLACRKVEVAGVRCRGRNKKTWKECVEDDMKVLGLHAE